MAGFIINNKTFFTNAVLIANTIKRQMFTTLTSLTRRTRATTQAANHLRRAFSTSGAVNADEKHAPWEESKVLVTGCQGQIGVPLVNALVEELGADRVIATDASEQRFEFPCEYEKLDVTDEKGYHSLVKKTNTNYIVHLAGILSALGEKNPDLAIDVNVFGVVNALRAAKDMNCRIFVPSTIGVFGGDHFNKVDTPEDSILQPKTIYGVGKVFNELIGDYHANKFGIDFRSIRYPGVISSQKYAFNGTTDYSTEIFFKMLETGHYTCWLREDAALPMIYIDDCIEATVKFLKADKKRLTRTCYNLAGISFTPGDFCREVQKIIPGSTLDFEPDFRQAIADSWPKSLSEPSTKADWDWSYNITTEALAKKILDGIDDEYKMHLTDVSSSEMSSSDGE